MNRSIIYGFLSLLFFLEPCYQFPGSGSTDESSSQMCTRGSMDMTMETESGPSIESSLQPYTNGSMETTMGMPDATTNSFSTPSYGHVKKVSLKPGSSECSSLYGKRYGFDDYLIESLSDAEHMDCMITISDDYQDAEKMIVKLNRKLTEGETVTVQSGSTNHTLDHATELKQCFLTNSDIVVRYEKLGSAQSSLQLLLTEFGCSSEKKCDKTACGIDFCQGYDDLENCPVACIDEDNYCNGLQQCPLAEDEACKRKGCPWWGILVTIILILIVISLIAIVVVKIIKRRRKAPQRAMHVPIFTNSPSKKSVNIITKKHRGSEEIHADNAYTQLP